MPAPLASPARWAIAFAVCTEAELAMLAADPDLLHVGVTPP